MKPLQWPMTAAVPWRAGVLGMAVITAAIAGGCGVGSAGTQRSNRLIGKLAQGLLEFVLHRATRGLALPALISAAVVAQADGDSHNCRAFTMDVIRTGSARDCRPGLQAPRGSLFGARVRPDRVRAEGRSH